MKIGTAGSIVLTEEQKQELAVICSFRLPGTGI